MASQVTGVQVGEEVTIRVRNLSPMHRDLFPNNPVEVDYSGIVVRREEWDPKDAVRITGDSFMPIRVISKSLMVSINGVPVAQPDNKPATVPIEVVHIVEGSKGKKYSVTVTPDGSASCTCTGYGFRGYCKHSAGIIDKIKQGEPS